jgi:AcrR family transcriptional regulator
MGVSVDQGLYECSNNLYNCSIYFMKVASAHSRPRAHKVATEPRIDRKGQILLSAERLFAEFGYHAVSIRQIAQEAQVPVALVGYYYGQKKDLFHAIFQNWSGTIDERMQGLREVEKQAHSRTKLQRIIEAFVIPVISLRASPEGESYALLMTLGASPQSDESDRVLREFFDPMAEAFITAIHATLRLDNPNAAIPRSTAAWCYQFSLGSLVHHLADTRLERLSHGQCVPNDVQVQPHLIQFIVHGIRGAVQSFHPPVKKRRLS